MQNHDDRIVFNEIYNKAKRINNFVSTIKRCRGYIVCKHSILKFFFFFAGEYWKRI